MAKVEEYQQMMAWLTRPKSKFQEPRIMDQAALVDELEPGELKDELKGKFDPSQETYEEYLQRINLQRPFNMAEGGPLVGTPTKDVTQFDRRIYKTPEGERVSEKSTTLFFNGKWLNVPTIHNGRAFTDDQLRNMLKYGKIQATSEHTSRMEAEEAAAARSSMMKSHTRGFGHGGRIGFSEKPGSVKTKLSQKGLEYKRGRYGPSLQTQANIDLIKPVRQKYIDLKQAQIDLPEGGTLKDFPNYERFLIQEIDSVKDTADAKKLISSTQYYLDPPETLAVSKQKLLNNLINIENNKPGRSRAGHELAVQAGYVYKSKSARPDSKTTTAPSGSFKNLINIEQKKLNRIDDVFNKIDKGLISIDDIANKGGSLVSYINEPFGFKSTESFSTLLRGKKYKDRLDEINLLNKSSFIQKYKGRGVLANEAQNLFEQGRTGGRRFTSITQSGPIKKIFDFADRHIERGGELVRKIDDNTFVYNNKIFSTSPGDVDQKALKKLGLQNQKVIDLVLEGPKQKEFTEIFNAFDKLKEYETMERAHPVTGKKTNLTKLLQEADYIAGGKDRLTAKSIFSRNPFEIDHFGSVKDDPFKNIRVIPRTINQAAGQFQRGVSTFKDIKQAEDFIGYSFTGDPLDSINQYINTEIQRGQNPDYTGRSRKIAAAKTKAIDTAAAELGQIGTRGGTILTQKIPPNVLGDRSVTGLDKRLTQAYTGVPVLEKTPGGKLTIGSRPVTEKEIISVPERDAMAKKLKERLLKINFDFLPKKLSTPLEFGQKIIRGTMRKDGGRISFGLGNIAKRGAQGAFTPTGIATILPPDLDLTKAENRIGLAAEAAFLPDLVKASIGATKGMKNRKKQKLLQQLLNLGVPTRKALSLARIASPIGWASLGLEGLYQAGKYGIKRRKELQAMSPEERAELKRQADDFSFGEYSGAAEGGIMGLKKKW